MSLDQGHQFMLDSELKLFYPVIQLLNLLICRFPLLKL